MKPPPFEYHDPSTLDEAMTLLGTLDNCMPLAGGQSLMPMLNMRFVFPDHLVDLNGIAELASIQDDGDALVIGAMTRQVDVEMSEVVASCCPLFIEALAHVGHLQTRNRGTVGGSLAHLDPAAEIPTVCAAAGAEVAVMGAGGERRVPFSGFATGYMTSCLDPGELLVAVRLPHWPTGHGHAFEEFAQRHGDFAIACVAAMVSVDGAGRVERLAVAVGGVAEVPVCVDSVHDALHGRMPTPETIAAAAATAQSLEALDDVHAPAAYRQRLAVTLIDRALTRAVARATAP